MKAIKIAVAIMSIFLVVGFGVVIYTISTRMSDGTLSKGSEENSQVSVEVENSTASLATPFGQVVLPVPAGCRLADAQLQGNKVLLRFDGDVARDCQKVKLYSVETGKLLGSWQIDTSSE